MSEVLLSNQTDIETEIVQEQIRLVFDKNVFAISGSFIAAAVMLVLQWDIIDQFILLAWFAVLTVFNIVRVPVIIYFRKKLVSGVFCQECKNVLLLTSLIAGIIWVFGVWLSFPEHNLAYQMTLVVIIIGLGSGAVSTLSEYILSFYAFILPPLIALVLKFVLDGDELREMMILALIISFIFIARGAMNIFQSQKRNLLLLHEAEEREKNLILANEKATQSNLAKSRFLANMSHELRTPLHGIISFSKLGKERINDLTTEKLREYFSLITQSGHRLKILLDDLLDLSKLEAGKFVLKYEEEDIESIFDSCIMEQDSVLKNSGIIINKDIENDLPDIRCDRNRIGQVFMNLIGNAIKFSPENAKIFFAAHYDRLDEQNAIHLVLTDQGPGVEESELETIFDKFVQSENQVNDYKGTGLGLAISKELIELHGGRIWCKNSDQADMGAEFHILLPVSQN